MVTLLSVVTLVVSAVILSYAGAWAVAFGMTAMMVLSALTYRLALLALADTVRLHQERVVTEVGRGS